MTIRKSIKKTEYFKELNNESFFETKENKVLSAIDSLYYSAFAEGDVFGVSNEGIMEFLACLKELSCELLKKQENKLVINDFYNMYLSRRKFANYNFCISISDLFDIFVCEELPNEMTPRFLIQLRSKFLWQGEYEALNKSMDILKVLLDEYDITICECKENRIDYAHHTNLIQSSAKFFKDENLENTLVTTYKKFNKTGKFTNGKVITDYLRLGQRSSNNTFFRCYNKTKEVCDMGYKEFFFHIWLGTGLISEYDYDILSRCYVRKNYDYLGKAMLKHYLENSKNKARKQSVSKFLADNNNNLDDCLQYALTFMPKPTEILNFEFQTMRKFYANQPDISMYPIKHDTYDCLVRLYQILDNRSIQLKYLTNNTICFYDNAREKNKICAFWKTIQNCKVSKLFDGIVKREYFEPNLDVIIQEQRVKRELGKYGALKGSVNDDVIEDVSLLLNSINDNTMHTGYTDEVYYGAKLKKLSELKVIN